MACQAAPGSQASWWFECLPQLSPANTCQPTGALSGLHPSTSAGATLSRVSGVTPKSLGAAHHAPVISTSACHTVILHVTPSHGFFLTGREVPLKIHKLRRSSS